jgi:hypothetical protein
MSDQEDNEVENQPKITKKIKKQDKQEASKQKIKGTVFES